MTIEQIYTGCLAQGAYYIRSGNEAAIIDPLREVDSYIERARNDGATIKYILETHFHADFVSGHLDLAAKTGATIVFGPTAAPKFKAHIAIDGEELKVGNIVFKVLHTPGHTMESTTYLLKDEDGKEVAIFTGDTLFLGDVGRPDLAQKAAHLTKEQLAGLLFDSLHAKIIPLSDSLTVYPAHGAGSACGKNMSKDTVDTLGHQKQTNYALRASMSREEFINEVTDGLVAPPAYFPENVRMNKEGYESIDKVIKSGTQPLTTEEFEWIANETGALILDTRSANDFRMGFIPNSINIGIEGSFAPWVGALIPGVNQPLLIISDKGREEEVVTRLARVGYDNTLGYLNNGFESWVAAGKETDTIDSIAAEELSNQLTKDTIIIDVRKQSEFQAEHVEGAINLPLDFINDHLAEIPKQGKVFVHCAGGYRSMIAISILKARGWDNLIDVSGGFKAIAETAIPRTNFVCAK
ncbi:MAG: MBL fold metallo-hydrolase [Chryseotalea sp. WA131a]|nr:MAG: MBL fold metallo-hydrolase [Chryseotalea sp. WA131a]